LKGILALQAANLRRNLTAAEAEENGFLTAEYTLDFLRRMHQSQPSVIAVDGGNVVGYALAATPEVCGGHPLLADLHEEIDRLQFAGRSLKEANYIVVGQLCVAKGYRGIGLVDKLYQCFREAMQGNFLCAVTDIARANRRSLRAHQKTGFQTIQAIQFEGMEWDVVLWDWSVPRNASEISEAGERGHRP
jgi:GNAT superfamily N-acetyltransferase